MLPLSTVSTSYTITFFLITHGADEVIAVVMGMIVRVSMQTGARKGAAVEQKAIARIENLRYTIMCSCDV